MRSNKPADIVIRARDLHELFSERDFDPLEDDLEAIWSIVQIVRLPEITSDQTNTRLRIILPAAEVSPQTESRVRQGLKRYCSRKLVEARLEMIAWRRGAWSSFFWGLVLFAATLLLTAGLQHATFFGDEIRTLATESLIIAGWVILWQPMETLLLGWLPMRAQERRFRALASMDLTVEAG